MYYRGNNNVNCDEQDINNQNTCTEAQTHVHEFEESTKLAEEGDDRHNHRVAGVTSEVILIDGGPDHRHAFLTNTDFLDHHHEIGGITGPVIPITGSTKHVHLMSGTTTTDDGHQHEYLFKVGS